MCWTFLASSYRHEFKWQSNAKIDFQAWFCANKVFSLCFLCLHCFENNRKNNRRNNRKNNRRNNRQNNKQNNNSFLKLSVKAFYALNSKWGITFPRLWKLYPTWTKHKQIKQIFQTSRKKIFFSLKNFSCLGV